MFEIIPIFSLLLSKLLLIFSNKKQIDFIGISVDKMGKAIATKNGLAGITFEKLIKDPDNFSRIEKNSVTILLPLLNFYRRLGLLNWKTWYWMTILK